MIALSNFFEFILLKTPGKGRNGLVSQKICLFG